MRFFEGVAQGFGAAIQAARPVFEAFVAALRELGDAFGVIGTASADAPAAIGSDRYARAGASLGDTLARIATVLVDGLTIVVCVAAGFVTGLRAAFTCFRPVFAFVGQAIGFVAEELRGLVADCEFRRIAITETSASRSPKPDDRDRRFDQSRGQIPGRSRG